MTNEPKPTDAQPGKGAAGNQWAVQTAQSTEVNNPEERIPSGIEVNASEQLNEEQVRAQGEQELIESGGDYNTSDGYTVDEAGQLNNFAIEPPVYVEE
ncbi:MAG TPA: hypothetical protein V6D03_14165 [Candidatus Caenarcaniphilales bacterium]